MDGLTKLVIAGDPAAKKLVQSALTNPVLLNTDSEQGTPFSIVLECENLKQTSVAQVSENLLIMQDGKKNITDNIAPSGWEWHLSGYIIGNKILEPSNYYTPIVMLNTDILRQWYRKGAVLAFKDANAQLYENVVIKNLELQMQKDARNVYPFSMILKEVSLLGEEKTSTLKKALFVGTSIGVSAAQSAIADFSPESKESKRVEQITWPEVELQEDFQFDVVTEDGNFNLHFIWQNERWDCFATIPDGTVRQAGVVPNLCSWTGFRDYGISFKSDLDSFTYETLFDSEIYICVWA